MALGLSMRLVPPLYKFLRHAFVRPVGDVLLNVVWAVLLLAGVGLLVSMWKKATIYTDITLYEDGVGTVMRSIGRESFTPYVSIQVRYPKGDMKKGLELCSQAYVRPIRISPHDITHYNLLAENLERFMQEDAQRRAQAAQERREQIEAQRQEKLAGREFQTYICGNESVKIRKLSDTLADRQLLLRWLSTPALLELAYGECAPWDMDKIEEHFIGKIVDDSTEMPCIIECDEDDIGYVQYYPLDEDSYKFNEQVPYSRFLGGYGIDIFIGDPKFWGKNIGTEAVTMLSDYLLEEVGAKVVCADPEEKNMRSVRCWEKAGFTPMGKIENYDEPEKQSIFMAKFATHKA